MTGRVTRAVVRRLDRLAVSLRIPRTIAPPHLGTGRRGEEDAYFHLRKLGYVMVARNFRLPGRRGEIDLIGWDGDVLCFIEVTTRTSHAVEPAEVAVDRAKQRQLAAVAEGYRRHLPRSCQWRFDVISVYYEQGPSQPRFELFKNCRLLS